MSQCFFVSDLHGKLHRYEALFSEIEKEKPAAVFFGGDLLPSRHVMYESDFGVIRNFITDYLITKTQKLRKALGKKFPAMFIIMGNDDPRIEEKYLKEGESMGLWQYIHQRKVTFGEYTIFGYAMVPPSPFLLKDWERYDVGRYVDPGCVHPTSGYRSVKPGVDIEYTTIRKELEELTAGCDVSRAVFLFHSPPYKTYLDRAALDGKMIDYVPLDVHVGSIAMKEFIEERQPYLTMHGHIHEASDITGYWKQTIGKTQLFSAAYHKKELALISFDINDLQTAERKLL